MCVYLCVCLCVAGTISSLLSEVVVSCKPQARKSVRKGAGTYGEVSFTIRGGVLYLQLLPKHGVKSNVERGKKPPRIVSTTIC